jgi:hypothetical protein
MEQPTADISRFLAKIVPLFTFAAQYSRRMPLAATLRFTLSSVAPRWAAAHGHAGHHHHSSSGEE